MKLIQNIHFLVFSLLIFTSCKSKSSAPKSIKYNKKYVVTFNTIINDSTIHDQTIEYFAYINLNDSICNWKKQYFHRVYEDLNSSGTAYLSNSLEINYQLNSDFEIEKIVNWDQIYSHIKKEADKILLETPDDRKKGVMILLNQVSLDSANIINKNTQEIQVFNIGLHFLFDELNFDKSSFKIKKNRISTTLSSHTNDLDLNSTSFDELKNFVPEGKNIDLDIKLCSDIKIIIDNKKKEINYLQYSIYSKNDDFNFSKIVTFIRAY